MLRAVTRTLLPLLAVICAVIPGANAGATVSSGIEGQVLIGPTCPAVRAGDQKCADRPYRTTITIKSLDGLEVARFTTDAQGRFHVALEPGRYLIKASSAKRMTVFPVKRTTVMLELPPNQVEVMAGEFTDLKLVFDSGIR